MYSYLIKSIIGTCCNPKNNVNNFNQNINCDFKQNVCDKIIKILTFRLLIAII